MQTRKNGIYYFRQVVPKELRDIIGKKEIVKSLKTKDYKEAKKRDMELGLNLPKFLSSL